MPTFLAAFTLHDSWLAGLWLDAYDFGIVVAKVHWDVIPARNRLNAAGLQLQSPTLFIRFPEVPRIGLDRYGPRSLNDSSLTHVTSRLLSPPECETVTAAGRKDAVNGDDPQVVPVPSELYLTSFNLLPGDHLDIYHGRDAQLLCVDEAGQHITLPENWLT